MKNTTTTTTTTKIKIVYFLFFAIGLTLLCVLAWSDSIFKDAFTSSMSFIVAIPALFKSLSIRTLTGFAIIILLIFADVFYKFFEKAKRRNRVKELLTDPAQEKLAQVEIPLRKTPPPRREKEYYQHRSAYYQFILPMRQTKPKHEIMKELNDAGIIISERTYGRIEMQGDSNRLANPIFKKRKKKKKGQL